MGLIWMAGAVLWGAAEASFFFIVPDVLLTLAVLRRGVKPALLLAVLAALSATATGALLWLWSGRDPAAAHAAMLWVPAVGPDLLARVAREFGGDWPLHLFTGAISGCLINSMRWKRGRATSPCRFS